MVERYVALAYDKGAMMRSAKDSPQPLLWPQLRVSDGEIPHLQRIWHFVRTPDDWVLPARSLVRQNAGRTITMQSWRNSLSMKAIRLCCLARRKIMRRAMKFSPRSVPSNRPGAETAGKRSSSRRLF